MGASAQQLWKRYREEVFFGVGVSNFLGDLGGANAIGTSKSPVDTDIPSIKLAYRFGYNYKLGKYFSWKTNLIYGNIGGDDKYTEEMYRHYRNLNFRSPVVDASTLFEVYYTHRQRPGHRYILKGVRGLSYIEYPTHIFFGIGSLYFDPRGEYNDSWFRLKPLCTEGQGLIPSRKKYSSIQFTVPYGFGFKFAIAKDWQIEIEYGYHRTFTDYLDDCSTTYFDKEALKTLKNGTVAVYFSDPSSHEWPDNYTGPTDTPIDAWTNPGAQRGDPRDKDAVMFAFISFYYKLSPYRRTVPKW